MINITMEFARQDDCLEKMVPSDLRLLVGERDRLLEQLAALSQQDAVAEVGPARTIHWLPPFERMSVGTKLYTAPPSTAQEDKHEWDGSLERCLKCGDKDWFAGPKCEGRIKPSQPTAQGVEHLMELIGEYFEIGVSEGAEGRSHDTEEYAAQRKLEQIQSALSGMVMVPVEPSRGLLVSMAMRNDHGFDLLSSGQQESILQGMRQIHEEVVGTGFYKPERESEYLETLKAASKGE